MLGEWLAGESQIRARSEYPFFAARHLDEMGIPVHGDSRDVDAGVEVLRAVGAMRDVHGVDVVPKLAVPFGDVSGLDTELPDLGRIPVLAPYEPPSLYLFAAGYLRVRPDREEYRCSYPGAPWGDDLAVEYVCGRSMFEREHGWEFGKTVWVSLLDHATQV